MTAALEVIDLSISAGPNQLVRPVSFRLEHGAALTILGETGSGKSLLSQAIMGALPAGVAAEGQIVIEGVASRAGAADRRHLWGTALALLPQEPWLSLDPTMRSLHQVAEGYRGETRSSARDRAFSDLRKLGLGGSEHHYPFRLSGGMAQRVALAATMAGGARLLIVDEPTKGLDAALRDEVVALLRRAVGQGATLLTITHDVAVARQLGDEVAIMLEGKVVEQGPAEIVLRAPTHDYTRKLLGAEPSAWPGREPDIVGDAILSGRALTKSFGGRTLFERLDIVIGAGQRVAVAGPSGSGKTTIGNILLGLTRADGGAVERAPHLAALRFQKLYQDPVAAFAPRASLRQSFSDLIARHRLEPARLDQLMARLRLNQALLDRRPDQVSGGELQRLAMVRLLMIRPAFIFADEPTSRLDLISQKETIDLLIEQAEENDCALLLVTHDPAIASNLTGDSPIVLGGAR